jgi:hypothetical protein
LKRIDIIASRLIRFSHEAGLKKSYAAGVVLSSGRKGVMSIEKHVEKMIREAMERGEFDNLPGRGQPIDLSDYFAAPEDMRIGHKLLKDANIVPEELELLKEAETLKTELARCSTEEEKRKIRRAIDEKLLKYNLLKERHKLRR